MNKKSLFTAFVLISIIVAAPFFIGDHSDAEGPTNETTCMKTDGSCGHDAHIGNNGYDRFDEAIIDAYSNQGKACIELLNDADCTLKFEGLDLSYFYETHVTINLNEHTLTFCIDLGDYEDYYGLLILYGDKMEIVGPGTIIFSDGAYLGVMHKGSESKASLELHKVDIISNSSDFIFVASEESFLNLVECDITSNKNGTIIHVSWPSAIVNIKGGNYSSNPLEIENNLEPTVTKLESDVVDAPDGYYWKDDTTLKLGSDPIQDAIQDAIDGAISEIEKVAGEAVSVINGLNHLSEDERNAFISEIESTKGSAISAISAGTTIEDVEKSKDNGIEAIETIVDRAYAEDDLDSKRAFAIDAVNKAASDKRMEIESQFHLSSTQKRELISKVDAEVSKAIADINSSATPSDVNEARDAGIEAIKSIEIPPMFVPIPDEDDDEYIIWYLQQLEAQRLAQEMKEKEDLQIIIVVASVAVLMSILLVATYHGRL